MIDEVVNELKILTEKYDCSGLFHNIKVTTDVMSNNKTAKEAEILSVALSFMLDYAIDRKNTDIMHEVYDIADRNNAAKELQGNKAYQLMYRLEDEIHSAYPRSINELITFMDGLDNTHTEYDILPYDAKSRLKFE